MKCQVVLIPAVLRGLPPLRTRWTFAREVSSQDMHQVFQCVGLSMLGRVCCNFFFRQQVALATPVAKAVVKTSVCNHVFRKSKARAKVRAPALVAL